MYKFLVHDIGKASTPFTIRNAYLLGSDNCAMRADIQYDDGVILCRKKEAGAAALALQLPVGDCGELTLQTCLLPEREDAYPLCLELARHRLMILYNKLEDWAMFDLGDDHPVTKRADLSKRLFIEALCQLGVDPARSEKLARDCLVSAVDATEELAVAHAELLLTRRRSTNSVPRHPIGVGVNVGGEVQIDRLRNAISSNFDFIRLPMPWRLLSPEEEQYRWAPVDSWIEWASKSRIPVMAGPVVSFDHGALPDWLYIWEHDYETLRDVIYEHVERVVSRYRNSVGTWTIASGLHLNGHFNLSFDQLMDLTRMSVMLVKKIQPAARVLVEIRQPFGEYYSTNPRSIPPTMYADLLVQGQVPLDGFSLKLLMGQAQPGQNVRDLMQISNLLDQFSVFGKPIHFCAGVPSEPVTELMLPARDVNTRIDPNCGMWRKPWSQLVQSRWIEAVMEIALSKPFIDSVAWSELIDHSDPELPLAGLIGEDIQPKTAFRRLVSFRRHLLSPVIATINTATMTEQNEQTSPAPSAPPVPPTPPPAAPAQPQEE